MLDKLSKYPRSANCTGSVYASLVKDVGGGADASFDAPFVAATVVAAVQARAEVQPPAAAAAAAAALFAVGCCCCCRC